MPIPSGTKTSALIIWVVVGAVAFGAWVAWVAGWQTGLAALAIVPMFVWRLTVIDRRR